MLSKVKPYCYLLKKKQLYLHFYIYSKTEFLKLKWPNGQINMKKVFVCLFFQKGEVRLGVIR